MKTINLEPNYEKLFLFTLQFFKDDRKIFKRMVKTMTLTDWKRLKYHSGLYYFLNDQKQISNKHGLISVNELKAIITFTRNPVIIDAKVRRSTGLKSWL